MKKIIVALALVLVLSVQSFAFAPLAYLVAVTGIPAYAWVTSAAVHVGAGAVGLYYALKSGQTSKTDSVGTISRPSSAVWIDTKDFQVVEKPLNAKLSKSEAERISSSNPTKYPKVNSVFQPVIPLTPTTLSPGTVVKEWYTNTGSYKVVRFDKSNTNTWGPSSPAPRDGTYNQKITLNHYGTGRHLLQVGSNYSSFAWDHGFKYCAFYEVSSDTSTNPVNAKVPPTVSQVVSSLSTAGADTQVKDLYQEELDQMMQDPDYIPVFSDATTGLPYVPPSQAEVMTPSQIDSHNLSVDAYNKKQQAAETAAAASSDAQTAATNAGAAYAASGGDISTGVGGDSSLYQKYLDAKAAASVARAASDAAQAALAQDALDDKKESDDTASDVPVNEERKTLDFTPLHALKSKLDTTYPFNLPGIVLGYYTALKSTPEAPQFDLFLPLGQTMHIDLSPFDSIAVLMRYLIGILLTLGIVYYIIHFFRGIS